MSGTEKVTIEQDEKVIYTIKETTELKNFSSYLDNMASQRLKIFGAKLAYLII